MRKIVVGVLAFMMAFASLYADKRYGIKSGIIKMTNKAQMNLGMGGGMTDIVSNTTIYFQEYGNKIAIEMEDTETTDGKTKQARTKMVGDGKIMHIADYEEKEIMKMDVSTMPFATQMFSIEGMKKQFNLKKVGTDKILGYKCDIYKGEKMEFCVHKGIVLKHSSTQYGTSSGIATSIKFNTSIDKSVYKLPNFPTTSISDMMKELKEERKKYEEERRKQDSQDKQDDEDSKYSQDSKNEEPKEEPKIENMQQAMDALMQEMQNLSPEERKQMESIMQGFGVGGN